MTLRERRKVRSRLKAAFADAVSRASTMCELRATSRAFGAAMKAVNKATR